MRRRLLAGAAVAVTAGLAGAGWSAWRRRDSGVAAPLAGPEQTLWSLRFDQPTGGELAMSSLRGKPLLLNFWATWCPPCVKEMPLLDAFYKEHRSQGWQVLGLAVDGPTPVREFLTRVPVSFQIGLAGLTGVDLTRSLGNQSGGLPFSVVFDRQGKTMDRKLGTVTEGDLADWAKRLSKPQ